MSVYGLLSVRDDVIQHVAEQLHYLANRVKCLFPHAPSIWEFLHLSDSH